MRLDPRFVTSGLALACAGLLFALDVCAAYVRARIHHRHRNRTENL